MIRIITVFLVIVSCSILSTEPKRPKGVPEKAIYDPERNTFDLLETTRKKGVIKKSSFKSWNLKGEMMFESYDIGDREYYKIYQNGKVRSEGFSDELNKPEKSLDHKKPENIPKEAEWNSLGLTQGWIYGKAVNGKKEGIWKLWYGSGKPKGFITFKDGLAEGIAKTYHEKDGSLDDLLLFKQGVTISSKTFMEKKLYERIKNAKELGIYPLPDNEPKIQDFFDKL